MYNLLNENHGVNKFFTGEGIYIYKCLSVIFFLSFCGIGCINVLYNLYAFQQLSIIKIKKIFTYTLQIFGTWREYNRNAAETSVKDEINDDERDDGEILLVKTSYNRVPLYYMLCTCTSTNT